MNGERPVRSPEHPVPGEPPRQPPVPRPPGASRYTWFVGVVFMLLVAVVLINTLSTGSDEEGRSTGPPVGQAMPPFAVPLALSDLEGDANVATEPGQGEAGARPACQVRGPDVLNVCQLYERGPVALAFLGTRGARCVRALDRLERARGAAPRVRVAAIAIRGDRDDLRESIRRRGWRFPVGYDRDGVLARLYGVAVCPQLTLADRGGRVRKTLIGDLSEDRLRRELRALARGG
jgi:hypothetical protein